MKAYLVGGAVRDELLGRPVHDLDYVVTGATMDQMKAFGFSQVGADFPVFLHPLSKDEYALARTERKQGSGYHGFAVNFDPSVTIEQDLERRDLTINAIAKASDGQLIDPFNGQQDLKQKQLRHVSDAFVEDPLRVLRVARFAAQLSEQGFTVVAETIELMRQLSHSGELAHLTAERVFKETEKALQSLNPQVYFEVLIECDAMNVLFPEMAEMNLNALAAVKQFSQVAETAWAIAVFGCEREVIEKLNQQYRLPSSYQNLAVKVCQWQGVMAQFEQLEPEQKLELLLALDAFRKPEILPLFIACCQALNQSGDFPPAELLMQAYQVCDEVKAKSFIEQGFQGKQISEQINLERLKRLA